MVELSMTIQPDVVPQQEELEQLAEYAKQYVKEHGDRVSRKQVLDATTEHFNILRSTAKYGMTYAWATGKVRNDLTTLEFVSI